MDREVLGSVRIESHARLGWVAGHHRSTSHLLLTVRSPLDHLPTLERSAPAHHPRSRNQLARTRRCPRRSRGQRSLIDEAAPILPSHLGCCGRQFVACVEWQGRERVATRSRMLDVLQERRGLPPCASTLAVFRLRFCQRVGQDDCEELDDAQRKGIDLDESPDDPEGSDPATLASADEDGEEDKELPPNNRDPHKPPLALKRENDVPTIFRSAP